MPTKAATDEENGTTFEMTHDGVQIKVRATTAEHRTPTIGEVEACLRASLERGDRGEMRQAPPGPAGPTGATGRAPQTANRQAGINGPTAGTGGNQPTGGNKKRHLTEEGRQKIRDSVKANWARKRAEGGAAGGAEAGATTKKPAAGKGAGPRRPHRAAAAAATT